MSEIRKLQIEVAEISFRRRSISCSYVLKGVSQVMPLHTITPEVNAYIICKDL